MALVIEDGTIVAGANSYVTVEEARAFALLRGVTLSAVDAEVEILVIEAMDYVEAKGSKFKGSKYTRDQSLQWPRSGATVDGYTVLTTEIPTDLTNAVSQLVIDGQDETLQPTGAGQEILKEEVGPIKIEYAERGSSTVSARFNKAEAFLKPVLRGSFAQANVYRG